MPRIILKSNYLQTAHKNVSGFLNYIATRDGVVKYSNDSKLLPATRRQKQTVAEFLEAFPDSKTLFEYEDYQKNPNRENASDFLSSASEYYLLSDKYSSPELYGKYIATRPNSEKVSTHGLFGMTDHISLKDTMTELEEYRGNVYTHILSLRREDAERLGYDDVNTWINLVRSKNADLAKQTKIKPQNLKWYGAFHNESHHPHIHLMVYSKENGEGYLSNYGINALRSSFAKTIFKQDLLSVYENQTSARGKLSEELKNSLWELEQSITRGDLDREPLRSMLIRLAEDLSCIKKGKKIYGYLPKVLKEQVDALLDSFAEEESIANCYTEWNKCGQEILHTYSDKPMEVPPLSKQKEFHFLKNTIITYADQYTNPIPPHIESEQSDASPVFIADTISVDHDRETPWTAVQSAEPQQERQRAWLWSKEYKACRSALYQEKDFEKAYRLLLAECQHDNPLAYCDLARLYADGLGVAINPQQAQESYRKGLELLIFHCENSPSNYLEYRIGKMYP